MKAPLAALLAMPVAACGGDEADQAQRSPGTEQIARVSTPANSIEADPRPAVALQPLGPADLAEEAAGCRFVRGGLVLVAASESGGIARVGGTLRHFVASAPVDASGAFLEDRQLSISIGRTGEDGNGARVRVTNRRSEAEERWAGTWSCAR